MKQRQLTTLTKHWQLSEPFVIARSARIDTDTIKVEIKENNKVGFGECVPTDHYDESIESVLTQIESVQPFIEQGISREQLQTLLPAGAARNALDCALWDLEAKIKNTRVSVLLNVEEPEKITTVQTISIDTPENMGKSAAKLANYPYLKIKLNRDDIIERLTAVHQNAPHATLLIDANESWDITLLKSIIAQIVKIEHHVIPDKSMPVVLIEQPLPRGQDELLHGLRSPIAIGADESCHTAADINYLSQFYDVINIKLDKCGGLTEALLMVDVAKLANVDVMIGCMVGSSLSMAPAMFIALAAKFVDLDGPTLIEGDCDNNLCFNNGVIRELPFPLWGGITPREYIGS